MLLCMDGVIVLVCKALSSSILATCSCERATLAYLAYTRGAVVFPHSHSLSPAMVFTALNLALVFTSHKGLQKRRRQGETWRTPTQCWELSMIVNNVYTHTVTRGLTYTHAWTQFCWCLAGEKSSSPPMTAAKYVRRRMSLCLVVLSQANSCPSEQRKAQKWYREFVRAFAEVGDVWEKEFLENLARN